MKVIILAGGYGTRLGEITNNIPKPMVRIGEIPIIIHIMNIYAHYGHKDFYIALGYKSEVIKDFFKNFNSDWNIDLIDTGLDTLTGGRCKVIQKYIKNEPCFLTYGDGVSNIDINDLLKFHSRHGKKLTISAVHPPARFGELKIDGHKVTSFIEKPQLQEGWINGGFFVCEPSFFDYITEDVMLEREPIERAVKDAQICAYKHEGFWQCMDTLRDKQLLEKLWIQGRAPWRCK